MKNYPVCNELTHPTKHEHWYKILYVLQDVYLFDSCEQIFVWVGQNASPAEKRNGMTYAHVSSKKNKCTSTFCFVKVNFLKWFRLGLTFSLPSQCVLMQQFSISRVSTDRLLHEPPFQYKQITYCVWYEFALHKWLALFYWTLAGNCILY